VSIVVKTDAKNLKTGELDVTSIHDLFKTEAVIQLLNVIYSQSKLLV